MWEFVSCEDAPASVEHCSRGNLLTRRSAILLAAGAFSLLMPACGGNATSGVSGSDTSSASKNPPTRTEVEVRESGSPAAAARSSEFSRMLDAGEVSSIRLIGDSITAGYECDGYGPFTDLCIYDGAYGTFYETAPEVSCWANDFRSYARDRGVGTFVNAGICGAKMRWLAEDADPWLDDGADVIFVMLGTNDAVYHTEDDFRSSAEAGLASVADSCKHMVVLAPPDNAWVDYEKTIDQATVERVLREVCESHSWSFVSLYDAIELGTDQLNSDGCHPTSKGSHRLWDRVKSDLGL